MLSKVEFNIDIPRNKVTEASHVVALEIAMQKTHTIGENLINLCSFKMVVFVLANGLEKKLAAVSDSTKEDQRHDH